MRLRAKLSVLVSIIVISSFGVTFYRTSYFQNELIIKQTERQARMLARQVLLTRKWVADHDGLFFIKKPGVESNPFLSDSDIQDIEGQVYVKRNPAMVTRELSEYASEVGFCRFRVTSLKPVNPDNAPDEFEKMALQAFEAGTEEVIVTESTEKGRILRYMMPLEVEESCLTCHARHGYKTGDIRGALSMTIPIAWADQAVAANNRLLLAIGALTTLLTGLTIFLLIDFMIVRRLGLLSAAMEKFPEQEIDKEDLPGGHDEIGELSDNFSKLGNRFLSSRDELEKTREQMYQQEKMAAIGQLAAGIAHEVNNPLSGMQNCVKSIRESPEDAKLRARYLDLVDKGLQRIGHTVRQLLNFGRKEPLRRRSANVDEILRECLELLDFQLRGVELTLDLNIESPQLVDAEAMKQAFVNILLNGAQAMPDGGSLTVTSRENKRSFKVSFTDTGHGITPEQQEHIFEPFYTTKETGEGTGLGLSVSFSLIKRMNGEIRVASKPNKGATFTIEVTKPE
ncbi:MAG: DUF3365 domain-containing protein [Thermodesulfobacteriota bacterium]